MRNVPETELLLVLKWETNGGTMEKEDQTKIMQELLLSTSNHSLNLGGMGIVAKRSLMVSNILVIV